MLMEVSILAGVVDPVAVWIFKVGFVTAAGGRRICRNGGILDDNPVTFALKTLFPVSAVSLLAVLFAFRTSWVGACSPVERVFAILREAAAVDSGRDDLELVIVSLVSTTDLTEGSRRA
jgi:hypothetical protein